MREGYSGYTSELTDLSLKARAWNSYTKQASKAYGFSPRDYTHQCNTLQHVQNTLYSYVFFLCVFVCSWKFIWSIDNLTHGMDWGHCQLFCTQNKLVVAARSPNVKGQLRCSSQRPSPCSVIPGPVHTEAFPTQSMESELQTSSHPEQHFVPAEEWRSKANWATSPRMWGWWVVPVTGPNSNAGAVPHTNSHF